MNKISESIFSGKTTTIPMADVSYVQKHWYPSDEVKDDSTVKGYIIITKHTTWNSEIDFWNNNIFLLPDEGEAFMKAWCHYRYELEQLGDHLRGNDE